MLITPSSQSCCLLCGYLNGDSQGILAHSYTAVRPWALPTSFGTKHWVGFDARAQWGEQEVEVPPVTGVFSLLGSCLPSSVWVPGTW